MFYGLTVWGEFFFKHEPILSRAQEGICQGRSAPRGRATLDKFRARDRLLVLFEKNSLLERETAHNRSIEMALQGGLGE